MGNLIHQITTELIEKSTREFDDKLKSYIKAGLAQRGYAFSSESEFMEFAKARLAIIPNGVNNEIYLDFVNEHDLGLLIGIYSTKTEFYVDEFSGKMTVTFG